MFKYFTNLLSLVLLCICSVSSLNISFCQQPAYYVLDLGPAIGISYASEINNSVQIVGNASTTGNGFIWEKKTGVMKLLTGLSDPSANGINDSGQVVGSDDLDGEIVAFLWENGDIDYLESLGGNNSGANAINDSGKIVGFSSTTDSPPEIHAVLWEDGDIDDLGYLGDGGEKGPVARAYGINSAGWVVGESTTDDYPVTYHAFLYTNSMQDLGTLSGPNSAAYDINNLGEIVGSSWTTDDPNSNHAVLWNNGGSPIDLGTLVTGLNTIAFAINDSSDIVGSATVVLGMDPHAFLWEDGEFIDLNDSIGTGTGWVLMEALDINNRGDIVGYGFHNGQVRGFLLYKEPFLTITRPRADVGEDKLWIAGETDTIRWIGGEPGQLVQLEYSVNSSTTFTPITVVPADSDYYIWNKPNSILSTKCSIRIFDIDDNAIADTSDILKIKGYVLTRITNDNYEKFDANIHGWSYDNGTLWPESWWSQFNYFTNDDPYTNDKYPPPFHAIPGSSYIDWPLWVEVFSVDACYTSTFFGLYEYDAVDKWKANTHPHGAECFGFAASSSLAFSFHDDFFSKHPKIKNTDNLYALPISDEIQKTINGYYAHQYGKVTKNNDLISFNKDPRTTLMELKEMLLLDQPDIKNVSIFHGGGHTMVPIKLKRASPGSSIFNLYCYNSSDPGSNENSIIAIDSLNNTWVFYYFSWGPKSHAFYLEIPVSNYLNTPLMEKPNKSLEGFSNIEFFNAPKANIIYTSSKGTKIGCINGVLTNEIVDGIPTYLKNGIPSNPIGYYLPDDSYNIILSNIADTSGRVYLTVFRQDVIYDYTRDSANFSQVDRFRIDDGFSVVSPDIEDKQINLTVAVELTSSERILFINETQLRQNDSLYIRELNQSEFIIKNYGTSKTYDLELNETSTIEREIFKYNFIDFQANSSHTLSPNWNDLDSSTVTIFVDLGNDGTIDDTLVITNQSGNPTTFPLTVIVNNGWNMVSVPGLHPVNQDVTTWWPGKDPVASVYGFSGGYNQVTTVIPGNGYWMKNLDDDTLNTGDEWPSVGIQTVVHNPINGLAGWNLIGGYEQIVPVGSITTNPPGLQDGIVYGYSSGYTTATELMPGYAYWIKLISPGEIILSGTASKNSKSKSIDIKSDWGKIILTDASGKSYTLYSVNSDLNLSSYDMPPLPPDGIFDVRFGSGRFAENLNGVTNTIELRGVVYPVHVRVEDVTLLIQDETGQKLKTILQPGEQISIDELNKLFVSTDMFPVKYSLEQNYPNPFNPITKIKYSISQNNFVNLTIYDILGREVKTLVNEEKPAGSYEVEFDASEIASGVYIYKINAGNFIDSKKMILMK